MGKYPPIPWPVLSIIWYGHLPRSNDNINCQSVSFNTIELRPIVDTPSFFFPYTCTSLFKVGVCLQLVSGTLCLSRCFSLASELHCLTNKPCFFHTPTLMGTHWARFYGLMPFLSALVSFTSVDSGSYTQKKQAFKKMQKCILCV